MVVAQSLRSDDVVQVGLHELLHGIDVSEQLKAGRLEDVEDGDDVFVAKVTEQPDLAECAQTEHGVVEGVMRFMATLRCDYWFTAELGRVSF